MCPSELDSSPRNRPIKRSIMECYSAYPRQPAFECQSEKVLATNSESDQCATADDIIIVSRSARRRRGKWQYSRCLLRFLSIDVWRMRCWHLQTSFDWIANSLHKRLESERLSMLMSTKYSKARRRRNDLFFFHWLKRITTKDNGEREREREKEKERRDACLHGVGTRRKMSTYWQSPEDLIYRNQKEKPLIQDH